MHGIGIEFDMRFCFSEFEMELKENGTRDLLWKGRGSVFALVARLKSKSELDFEDREGLCS